MMKMNNTMNTDMPLDVFAKLCVKECRKLRVEKGQMLAEIDEKNDKIASLEKELKHRQDVIDLYESQIKTENKEERKEIKKEDMYKQILSENKKLKKMYDRVKHENSVMLTKLIQAGLKKGEDDNI